MLEKPFVVVPGGFGWAFGQAGEVFRIRDGFAAASGGDVREQGEIEALHWLAAFGRQLRADAAFFFEAGDFMAARAAVMLDPLLAFFF